MEDSKRSAPEHADDDVREEQETASEAERLAAQLGEAERTIADLRETVLRERAEIENQRRRMHRDVEQARRFANERLLGELLPVRDNLERGLSAEGGAEALREGMTLTLRSLQKVADAHGLKTVDPLGQPFNPELHEAMSMVDSPEHKPHTVVAVLEKGYMLNDRLLRPARVVVAKSPEDA